MKVCCSCRGSKPLDEFGKDKNRKDGLYPLCKPCRRADAKRRYHDNPSVSKASYRRNFVSGRERLLERTYGLRPGGYDAMLNRQNGVCAICQRPETAMRYGKVSSLCVDHDHATGQVRALLCLRCNYLIGAADENTATLREAAVYLESFRHGQ